MTFTECLDGHEYVSMANFICLKYIPYHLCEFLLKDILFNCDTYSFDSTI